MATTLQPASPNAPLNRGFLVALTLHGAVAAAIIAAAYLHLTHTPNWGGETAAQGSIQASIVSALPLPPKPVAPVEKSVLTPEDVSKAAAPPPTAKTQPPPAKNDILVKTNKPVTPAKTAPVEAPAPPKHPQPTPDTAKASSGQQATQIAQSTTPVRNGIASATVEDRAFGQRYAYYVGVVGRMVAQNWYTMEADPRSSQGKKVSFLFDIERDGTLANPRLVKESGSQTLDTSALHALQRTEGFGPLPAGDHITVEYTFEYHQP